MLQVPNSSAGSDNATVSDTAKAISHADFDFSAAELAAANRALISVTDDAIRWRKDGTAPTAAFGHYLNKDQEPYVVEGNPDIKRLQFIRVTTDAKVYVDLEI